MNDERLTAVETHQGHILESLKELKKDVKDLRVELQHQRTFKAQVYAVLTVIWGSLIFVWELSRKFINGG